MLPENPCRYDELRDGTLMRKEGSKEFRIYCGDAGEFPIRVITPGFCMALSEAYDRERARNRGQQDSDGEGRVRSEAF